MWNDNDKIIEVYNRLTEKPVAYPCTCPVCNHRSAHIYIHRHSDKHCGIWTWCSNCMSYSHMSGITPEWWKNPSFVDSAQLCAEPDYLEKNKDKIDDWLNSVVDGAHMKPTEPFTMENRFNAVLRKEFDGIPVGTSGTIVIKDDFKKVTVEFIDPNGRIINVNMTPEKLTDSFDVTK